MTGSTARAIESYGVYMDYQASTPLDPRVFDAMEPFLTGGFGNPHAVEHGYGWHADAAVESARSAIAGHIGADSDEIVFTSGATEANNLAVLGCARAAPPSRRRIVVSAIEHKCVLAAADSLAADGFEIVRAPVARDGSIDLDALAHEIDMQTALVSIMAVNNEIGAMQPMAAIADLCRRAGAILHSDAAQALAVQGLDVDSLGCDLISLSAHKAYGPKGVGALYVRREARRRIRPIMHGGGQEYGLRPGTLPTFLCVGFGRACELAADVGEVARIAALRERLLASVLRDNPGVVVNGPASGGHPGNLNLRFRDIAADLLLAAARPRLAASTGSACTSGTPVPSHVLRAIGLDETGASQSVRLSLGRYTTRAEVDEAAAALRDAAVLVRDAFVA